MAVSVTRAVKFDTDYLDNNDIKMYRGTFTETDAQELLKKKLIDIEGKPMLRIGDFMHMSYSNP